MCLYVTTLQGITELIAEKICIRTSCKTVLLGQRNDEGYFTWKRVAGPCFARTVHNPDHRLFFSQCDEK